MGKLSKAWKSTKKVAALPVQAIVAPKAAGRTVQEAWVPVRDAWETGAVLAGNYFLPGSSMLTGKMVSGGAQKNLNSNLGILAQLGTGAAGFGVGSSFTGIPQSAGGAAFSNMLGFGAAQTGTTGDMAALLQQANPALTAGEAMAAAESYAASGMTASQLANTMVTGGMLTAEQVAAASPQMAGGLGGGATGMKAGTTTAGTLNWGALAGAGLGLMGGADGSPINTTQSGVVDSTQTNKISYSPEETLRRDTLLRSLPELYAQSAGLYNPAEAMKFSGMLDEGIQYGLNARDPSQNQFVQAAIENAIRPVNQAYLDPNGVLANIRSSALGAGQYGGTRQGMAEGIAAGRYADAVGGISANMMNNAYNQGQNTFAQVLTAAPTLKNQAADAQQKQIWGPAMTYGDMLKSLQTPTTTTRTQQNSTGTASQPGQQSNPLMDALAGAVMGNYLYKSFV